MGFFDRFRKRVKEVADDTDLDALTAEEGSEEAEQTTPEISPPIEDEEWDDISEIGAPAVESLPAEDDDWDDWDDDDYDVEVIYQR